MKRILAAALTAIALFVAPASGVLAQEPKYGGILKMSWSTLDTSDFHRHTGTISVPQPFAETLTSISRDGQPRPFLAESWEISPDGKTYTIHLRKGVKFHNGRVMTSKDIGANLARIRDKVGKGWLTTAMKQVDALETPDDNTFIIKLKAPFAPLLNLLAEGWIIAPESPGWDEVITKPIGTGPFIFQEWIPGLKLVGPKFKDYWMAGHPYLDGIEFDLREVADPSLGLRAGDYQAAEVPLTKAAGLEKEPNVRVEYLGDTSWTFWSFNNNKPKPPFDNVRVREAITYALDKDVLMKIAAGDHVVRSNQMATPGNYFYDAELGANDKHAKPDIEKAKKILAEEHVDPASITLRVISEPNSRIAGVSAQMLKRIGFNADIKVYDDLGYQKALSEYEWDLFPGSSGPRNDIFLRYVRMMSDGPNPGLWGGIHDRDFDKLVNQAVTAPTLAETRTYYRAAWQRVMDNYYTVVVGHSTSAYGFRKELKGMSTGFNTSPHRVDGGVAFAWFDK